jgi:cbb3-type cytochrome oxidase cytochrome c subunit
MDFQEVGMALAVGHHRKKEVRTGLHMNILFFFMSVVVLIVMAVSMWKDTHPEWLSYEKKFVSIERSVLQAERADLIAKIEHPNYIQDYQRARQQYLDSKTRFDAASSALEGTEADLEEMEIRLQAGKDAEGGGGPEGSTAGTAPGKPSKNDLDELDKEFSKSGSEKADTGPSGKSGSNPKATDKEMADLDKEFAGGDKSKNSTAKSEPAKGPSSSSPASSTKPSDKEMADLDKEFASSDKSKNPQKAGGSNPQPAKSGSKADADDLASLDNEFKDNGKSKSSPSHGTVLSASSAGTNAPAYEEADLQVDQVGANARFESAQRDLLVAQRTHNKEMIGLPADATLKRQLSDGRLKEATETLAVAEADVALEDAKAAVKAAAQIAKWAADVVTLNELKSKGQLSAISPEQLKSLSGSQAGLQSHIEDLKRDLRLVEGRISRNLSGGPEVDQIYVDRLGAIDRCTTCHQAVEQHGFETVAEPFRTHSAELLRLHPIERFGCVSCHGGYGNALEKNEAHGGIIGKGRPLLVGDQVQSSCGKCHGETRQLAGEETYLAGSALFKGSGCLGCHKVDLGQPGATSGANTKVIQTALPKAGPDLDRVGEKIQPAWLVGWLQNPQSHSLDARMPNLGLERSQAAAIATFLLTQHGVVPPQRSTASTVTQQRLAQGRQLVENLGCLGCHEVRGEGASIGPELTNIKNKVNAEWLYGWIANPKSYFPNSRMPVFNLTRDQCVQIGDYLLSVGSGQPSPNDFMPNLNDAQAKSLGQRLIAERGCAGCHDIKGFDRISAPELTHEGDKTADLLEFGNARNVKRDLYDYLLTKITDPRTFDTDKFKGKMPKFGLAQEDARTIAIYLMSLSSQELPPEYTRDLQEQSSPLLAGRRVFNQHDCIACHRLAGEGGKVGPDLTREGEMVRPSWLFPFLKHPVRIRWWQDARMPNYHLSDEEGTDLTEFFMTLSNQPAPYEYTAPDQKVFPLAAAGEKYFAELKCQSCHPLAGKQGVAGGDTKKLGPDLGMAPVRLKKDWMVRFLEDPQAFSPGTQMPTFGKPLDMYLAIVDFLMKQRSP